MECFLHKLFYMSLTASYLVMIVILIRFLLVKAPKWIRVLLWSMCSIAACPLGFGETGVKGRIKNVLYYKKPSYGVVIGSVLICIVVAVCFLTNPHKEVMEKPVMEEQVKEDVEHKKLLDLADVYAELMNEVAQEGDCFATSDVTVEDMVVKEECVVFDAVIKEIMVDTKDCICISSKSDDYPGAFILVIPENDMNRNQ